MILLFPDFWKVILFFGYSIPLILEFFHENEYFVSLFSSRIKKRKWRREGLFG